MKKTYIQPLMKACEMDPNGLICGSGVDTQSLRMGNPSTDSGEAPEADSQYSLHGIFGESKSQGDFGDAW